MNNQFQFDAQQVCYNYDLVQTAKTREQKNIANAYIT